MSPRPAGKPPREPLAPPRPQAPGLGHENTSVGSLEKTTSNQGGETEAVQNLPGDHLVGNCNSTRDMLTAGRRHPVGHLYYTWSPRVHPLSLAPQRLPLLNPKGATQRVTETLSLSCFNF